MRSNKENIQLARVNAKNECDICFHSNDPSNQIIQTERWVVNLASNQAYLGRSYVTLRRHIGTLEQLDNEDWGELHSIIRRMEFACSSVFGASPFNWGCYMNKEFQEPPYNPHVHWHLFPRYRKPVEFSNIVFEDSKYGQMFDDAEEKLVDSNTQSQIRIRLRRAIEDFR